jgi:hypothetical protein
MSRVLDKWTTIALRDFYLSPECKQVHAVYFTGEIQDLVARIGEEKAVAVARRYWYILLLVETAASKKGNFCARGREHGW